MSKNKAIIWDSDKIKQCRAESGLTLPAAAEMLSVTPEYLYMLEMGTRQPGPRTLVKLSSLYRQPHAFFLVEQKNFVTA